MPRVPEANEAFLFEEIGSSHLSALTDALLSALQRTRLYRLAQPQMYTFPPMAAMLPSLLLPQTSLLKTLMKWLTFMSGIHKL